MLGERGGPETRMQWMSETVREHTDKPAHDWRTTITCDGSPPTVTDGPTSTDSRVPSGRVACAVAVRPSSAASIAAFVSGG